MTNPSSPFSHLNLKLKKQLEILLIISTKSVILTKNKKQRLVPDKDLGSVVLFGWNEA